MKKLPLLVVAALLCTAAMGLASRDWRASVRPYGELTPYDLHLQYYEQIRPALIGTGALLTALCNGEPAATGPAH